ncbi:MAG: PIG-L family deacetylase [Crocinitomicaceae bacterium]|nr:PIG-L family deacetylase [Crocinitomicaceae bacterium]
MKYLITLTLLIANLSLLANKRASEIYVDLQKLHSLNRVLYIAAHPDDENTRLLAYLSLGEKAETAYLSLTRGDGGQNLIGNELSEKLGVLRTQELLSARSYDGARQFFTRAVDFGYSKYAEESFRKWGKEQILSDVVLVIRKFRPDIIITRFPPDSRGGHGHHTASAILAIEAFEKAADPDYLPQQVEKYGAWKATSLYWNTSYWWMKSIADSAKKYPDKYFVKDIGGYSPQLGMSYNEIGTIARSQHKCQGFGAILERGSRLEYFEHLAGEQITTSFFEKSHQTWTDIIDETFENRLEKLLASFDFVQPASNLKDLLYINKRLEKLPDSPFKEEKLNLCNEIIVNCLGLYIEVVGDDYSFVQEEKVPLTLNIINRSPLQLTVDAFGVNGKNMIAEKLVMKAGQQIEMDFEEAFEAEYTNPYWLLHPYEDRFVVKDEAKIGQPESEPTLQANFHITVNGRTIDIQRPVEYKWRDPSFGEKRRDMICTPTFTANFENDILIVKEGEQKTVRLRIHSFADSLNDYLYVKAPKGWQITPREIPVALVDKHSEKWVEFVVKATENAVKGVITLTSSSKEKIRSLQEIDYPHITTQTLLLPSEMPCVKLDVKINPGKIAYIKGVDDAVPEAIRQLGFEVKEFTVADLPDVDLSEFNSVVLGIRIYNVHSELFNHHEKLFDYVESGGNLIMQYNTASRSIRDEEFGPAPFKLSRNRVTEEDAEVVFLEKDHPILNLPNKITNRDFDGWVQERGLYFAGEWSDAYTPILSWHDQGEEPVDGALIVMKHGKGQFVYTGISFFRELPKGVEGAYRLFANILSYNHE